MTKNKYSSLLEIETDYKEKNIKTKKKNITNQKQNENEDHTQNS